MTIFWPVVASVRICRAAVMMATSSGRARSASPKSIRPLRDLGRTHCIRVILRPRLFQQPPFPGEGGAHDGVEIVEPGLPFELLADAIGARHQGGRVTRAPRLFQDLQAGAGHPLNTLEHFPDAVAVSVADVENGRVSASAQIVERIEMRRRQVLDMDVVAYSRAVRSRIVGTENRHVSALADCRLAG